MITCFCQSLGGMFRIMSIPVPTTSSKNDLILSSVTAGLAITGRSMILSLIDCEAANFPEATIRSLILRFTASWSIRGDVNRMHKLVHSWCHQLKMLILLKTQVSM